MGPTGERPKGGVGDPIIEALERQEYCRSLITRVLLVSAILGVILGFALPDLGLFLAVIVVAGGIIGSFVISASWGKVKLEDENFSDSAKFSGAGR
jgi:uncharacterized membrane protein